MARRRGRGRVTLDQLIALNDEIVALTRAGVPLERGLLDLGSDLPGRLGRIATALGERMSRGESLPEALAACDGGVPRVYRAVVEAGLRPGRLSVALEGLAAYARGLRRGAAVDRAGLWYPADRADPGLRLFLFIATSLIPRFVDAFGALGVPTHASLRALDACRPVRPGTGGRSCRSSSFFLWRPGSASRAFGLAGEQLVRAPAVVPLDGLDDAGVRGGELRRPAGPPGRAPRAYPEALDARGRGVGRPGVRPVEPRVAEAVDRGFPPAETARAETRSRRCSAGSWRPGRRRPTSSPALDRWRLRYRSEARYQAEKIRVFLPTILLFGIGGTATVLYALTLFVPLAHLWIGPRSRVLLDLTRRTTTAAISHSGPSEKPVDGEPARAAGRAGSPTTTPRGSPSSSRA